MSVTAGGGGARHESRSRAWRRRGRLLVGRASWWARPLPDHLIIGTMKGGTTSLYGYLCQSPDVAPVLGKEVRYFSDRHDRSLGWYRGHFPVRRAGRLYGEASPNYLSHPEAPRRVHDLIPDARLIVVLRDPVERAYSQYQHHRARGREHLSFAEALAAESERTAGPSWDAFRSDAQIFGYRARGHYAEQLARWLAVFPRQQLLVLASERLYGDPEGTVGHTLDWLGARRPSSFSAGALNVGGYREDMPEEVRRELVAHYAAPNEALYRLVGERFAWASPDPGHNT